MIELLKKILKLIDYKQKIRLGILQIVSIIGSILETIGTISAAPLIAIVAEPQLIVSNFYLAKIYNFLGSSNNNEFIFQFSIIIISLFIIGSISKLFIGYLKLKWATDLYLNITENLFSYFINLPWLYHSSTSSDKLISKLNTDTKRFTATIILPFLDINSNLFLLFIILFSVFVVNYKIALFVTVIFVLSYLIIYGFLNNLLKNKGNELTKSYPPYFKALIESFAGIRDVILFKKQSHFEKKYFKFNKTLSNTELLLSFLGKIPRTIIEIIAFIFFILLYLFLIYYLEYSYVKSSTVLAFYFLCAAKMLPALQSIYIGYTSIKTHLSALDNIELDLKNSLMQAKKKSLHLKKDSNNPFKLYKKIELKDVSFNYKERDKAGISKVNIELPLYQKIGIVGKTGSGKSTLVDLIMGFLSPDTGKIYIDGVNLNRHNMHYWQSLIGYVPQNIFLTDDTIVNNIAFGEDEKEISLKKIDEVLRLSSLDEFIGKYNTGVGERGVRLSGGQKQRIAIARALYNGSEILFLDEATSSLDNKTENLIMNSLKLLFKKKTIIIVAHRIETIKNCDLIFLVEEGKIIDKGNFKELNERTNFFLKDIL